MKEFNPIVQSDFLTLRPYTKEDIEQIILIRSDEVSNEYLHREAPKSVEDIEKHLNFILEGVANEKWYNWGIVLPGDDKIIGTICLWNIDLPAQYAEIGYELLTTHKRKGLMSQAITMVLDFGFHQAGFKSIGAYTRMDNLPSSNILIKQGFILTPNKDAKEFEHYYEVSRGDSSE